MEQNKRSVAQEMPACEGTPMKPTSKTHEAHFRQSVKPTAPETIKETIKKKDSAEKRDPDATAANKKPTQQPRLNVGLGDFEKRVAKVFEQQGYGYEGFATHVLAADLEHAHKQFVTHALTFSQAVGPLLRTYKERDGQD